MQQVLIGLKLMAELMADLPNGHPGSIIATACYQDRLFDAEVRNLIRGAMVSWRDRFRPMFAAIERRYPTDGAITAADLADTFLSVVDGAIILSSAVREPKALAAQMMTFRAFVKMLYIPQQALA